MKNLKIILAAMSLTALLSSCNKEYKDAPPNPFIVKEIIPQEELHTITIYRILMLDNSGVGGFEFFMVDSVGKYEIGDRLYLTKNP